MRTASWTMYTGPGRIALSPAPAGTPRGYRLAPATLFFRAPVTSTALRARLADLNPAAMWSELHALILEGRGRTETARMVGVSMATLRRHLNAEHA